MRRSHTRRQIVEIYELHQGKCWRCGLPIGEHAVYARDWELGHADKAHWLGGKEYAPEHMSCNREDAKLQTKLAAKTVRQRARDIGIRKSPPKREGKWKYNWKTGRYEKMREP